MNLDLCTSAVADRLATRLLVDTDCQAFGLVERGYAVLSQPGGTIAAALTGLLTIAVALFGYRLLLGRGLMLRDAVGLAVKIGIVLLIATSWESWQLLAYDSFARAPTRIASELLTGIGAPDPLVSLQRALDNLEAAGVGYRTRAGIASPLVGGPAAAAMALNVSALILTLSIIGVLVAMRVVLAILLAIAPLMAGFILFDSTRGMAQGWVGAMATAAITPMFVLILASVEFAILGPIIARVLSEQATGNFETNSVMPIGLVAIIFAIAMLFALRAVSQVARGIRLPGHRGDAVVGQSATGPAAASNERVAALAAQTSAARVAQALESSVRRETPASNRSAGVAQALASAGSRGLRSTTGGGPSNNNNNSSINVAPLRLRSSRRPVIARRSRAATRRDA